MYTCHVVYTCHIMYGCESLAPKYGIFRGIDIRPSPVVNEKKKKYYLKKKFM